MKRGEEAGLNQGGGGGGSQSSLAGDLKTNQRPRNGDCLPGFCSGTAQLPPTPSRPRTTTVSILISTMTSVPFLHK